MGSDDETSRRLASRSTHPSSLARSALRRQTPKVGAGCSNWARPDLCGGCPVMGIPTAILGRLRSSEPGIRRQIFARPRAIAARRCTPCRYPGCRKPSIPAGRATQEPASRHHTSASARPDRVRYGGRMLCTTRPIGRVPQRRCPRSLADPNRNSSPLPWRAVEQVAPALSLGISAVLDLEPSHMRVVTIS